MAICSTRKLRAGVFVAIAAACSVPQAMSQETSVRILDSLPAVYANDVLTFSGNYLPVPAGPIFQGQ